MKKYLLLLLTTFYFFSCKTSKDAVPTVTIEERNLDTLTISAPREVAPEELTEASNTQAPIPQTLPDYNESYPLTNDLIHTKLDLKFDWAAEKVIGTATLTLKPYFYPTQVLQLDAKGFEISKIQLLQPKNKVLDYTYENDILNIQLDKQYTRSEKYQVQIDYIAQPAATGGSDAITSNQGLFFINPRGEQPNKPQQIWTQGETEWNSRWFPTIDKPNERTTQEVFVTIEDRFTTLSNGLLVDSKKNNDGTKTDHWKLDQPHAPYLFMLAIGEFARVEDKWNDIIVDYYVEPEYQEDARAIFSNTTEMLTFFSDKLGLSYPWPKYSQVVVRDYVSGAMENTTAVIFGDFVQRKKQDLIDDNNEKIIAHEMFHHWFGDLVTCESWANLTMNEGFANYSEYLWLEHKYGRDEADYHMFNEWGDYINSTLSNVHPLIHFGYNDKEDMFDRHSYNKGGAVLHMLRAQVGDDAFWAALNLYLTEHQYTAVEAHDLRLAFEEVTGQDLNWFFNQWYFDEGHPQLFITHSYDDGVLSLTVSQDQDPENMRAIFKLPVAVDIYESADKVTRFEIVVDQRKQTFEFEVPSKPKLVNFDAEKVLLAERQEDKTDEELLFQYRHAPNFLDRFEAVIKLMNSESKEAKTLIQEAINDPFWFIRGTAFQQIDMESSEIDAAAIRRLAANDPHSEVRALAYEYLLELQDQDAAKICIQTIEQDSSFVVVASALELLSQIDAAKALRFAKDLESEDNSPLIGAISGIYAQSENLDYLDYFKQKRNDVNGYAAFSFYDNYFYLASNGDQKLMLSVIDELEMIGTNMTQSPWRRIAAARAINNFRNFFNEKNEDDSAKAAEWQNLVKELGEKLKMMKEKEENSELKGLYDQLQLSNG